MRQAGFLAAAAIYALDNHVDRLAIDHRNAQTIAEAIAATPGLHVDPREVDTNLIWFSVDRELGTASEVAAELAEKGIIVFAIGPQRLRACTHLDVSTAQAEQAAHVIHTTVKRRAAVA